MEKYPFNNQQPQGNITTSTTPFYQMEFQIMTYHNQFKLKTFLLFCTVAFYAKICQTDDSFHHIEQILNIKLINYLPKVWFKYIRFMINHVIHDKMYSLKPLQMLLKNKYHVYSAIYSKLNQPDDTSNHTDMCYFYYTCYF